jgi:hypothetical protein
MALSKLQSSRIKTYKDIIIMLKEKRQPAMQGSYSRLCYASCQKSVAGAGVNMVKEARMEWN